MQIGNRHFPYPILNHNSIYSDYNPTSDFFFQFTKSESNGLIIERGEVNLKDLCFQIANPELEVLIDEGKLGCCLMVECSASVFREKYEISRTPTDVYIPATNFNDRVEFSCYLYAKEAIKDFDKAYALLASVPSEATECYQYAQKNKTKVYEKYLQKLSSDNYRKMLSEIASSNNQYNPVVGGYFQMIPLSSPEYTKAKKMYEDYISKTAKQAELEKNREYYLEKEKLEVQKLEIQAQIAASEAIQIENKSNVTIDTGNDIINMIIDQAVQIGVPHLIGLLL